jgi:hypothetical protein
MNAGEGFGQGLQNKLHATNLPNMDDCKNDGMTTSEQYMVMVKENIRGPVKRT